MQSRIKSIVILEIQNGMYAISTIDLILNAFINIWCVVFGVWIAVKRHGAVNG